MASPSVQTFERVVSFNVNSIESNASAIMGVFRWGEIDKPTAITTNESELVRKFGRPITSNNIAFHSAANFLLYSVPLWVLRVSGDDARNAVPTGETSILIRNRDEYDVAVYNGKSFIARCAGELGNSLKVSITDSVGFADWQYKSQFTFAPQPNQYNLVVIDEDGLFGSAGSVLERFELVSFIEGTKKSDGTSAYIKEVLKNQSEFIYCGDIDAIDFNQSDSIGVYETSFVGGVDDNDSPNYGKAIEELSNKELIDIVSVITAGLPAIEVGNVIDMCADRGDCVAFVSPRLSDVYNNPSVVNSIVEYVGTVINKASSFVFYDDNWKLVYDKYNDNTVWIPCSSDIAGLNSRVFVQNDPWVSFAGFDRGQIKNVIRLAWNSNKAQRDVLYPMSINSIISMTGEGTLLFGDKTGLKIPSAFTRINVRNLFIVLRKSISKFAMYSLFELNDDITRSMFKKSVDRYLESVQGRRGIIRYITICDETNNTAQVINSNEFVGDIYVEPVKSINFIKLNFVAVDAGVEFEEIEGAF